MDRSIKKWWQKMRLVPFFWQGAEAWDEFAHKAPKWMIEEEYEKNLRQELSEKRWFIRNLLSRRLEKEQKKLQKQKKLCGDNLFLKEQVLTRFFCAQSARVKIAINFSDKRIDFKAHFLPKERKMRFFVGINGKKKWFENYKIAMISAVFK